MDLQCRTDQKTQLVRILVRIWYSFGTHLVRIWCAYGTHMVRIWYAVKRCAYHMRKHCLRIWYAWSNLLMGHTNVNSVGAASSFGHTCASYGVQLRTWTGLGLLSGPGGVQAVNLKGNAWNLKLNEIGALELFHLAIPYAVSFVLSQLSSTAMLMSAFAQCVGMRRVNVRA